MIAVDLGLVVFCNKIQMLFNPKSGCDYLAIGIIFMRNSKRGCSRMMMVTLMMVTDSRSCGGSHAKEVESAKSCWTCIIKICLGAQAAVKKKVLHFTSVFSQGPGGRAVTIRNRSMASHHGVFGSLQWQVGPPYGRIRWDWLTRAAAGDWLGQNRLLDLFATTWMAVVEGFIEATIGWWWWWRKDAFWGRG